MSERAPRFQQTDTRGDTLVFRGTAGTTIITVPATPSGRIIDEVFIVNESNNRFLWFYPSSDSQNYVPIPPESAISFNLRGLRDHIRIRSESNVIPYSIALNVEGEL